MISNLEYIFKNIKGRVLYNEPMSKHTWLGVGGVAESMFFPKDLEDLTSFLKQKPKQTPVHILGGGSNLLVRDGGIKGIVIKLDSPYFKQIIQNEDALTCYAGLQNMRLKKFLIANELGGLEFLCSIPGTIGGAVKTNAGCFGKSLSDVLISALVVDFNGNIQELSNADFHFSYRHADLPENIIVISLTLQTSQSSSKDIEKVISEQLQYRKEHQPFNVKTAGSTFKNPEGFSAWKLIKETACDKLSIGGAKMSEKHCNFMINTGNATAEDCEVLGDTIIEKVKQKKGVTLEWEIQKIGQKK
ncbi:MAG TPA: UDP-N-acetylenolpyruvoylglucosamine reductase [Alphaproteobacteria bacterium]|nr:UDP-N-acetylenolpyruvoylglucosamine reductase [Alphaproteobacteria bacterium]